MYLQVAMWLAADDIGRMSIAASYLYYAAPWERLEAWDVKERLPPNLPRRPTLQDAFKNPGAALKWASEAAAASAAAVGGDPLFMVRAVKRK
jgi:hypothetical protein